MSTFVKLTPEARLGGILGVPNNYREFLTPSADSMGWRFPAGNVEVVADGEALEGRTVKAGQLVKIQPLADPRLSKQYTGMVGINPKLGAFGSCTYSALVEPGEQVDLYFKAYKATDLDSFEYLFKIYAVN